MLIKLAYKPQVSDFGNNYGIGEYLVRISRSLEDPLDKLRLVVGKSEKQIVGNLDYR